MVTVILQLTGAILLVCGLAFGKKEDIIGASIGQGVYFNLKDGQVPKIIEEKWKEVFLCRWGLSYTIIGYIIGMFEEELWPNIQLKIIVKVLAVLLLAICISIITYKVCTISARHKYKKTQLKDFEKNLRPGTLMIEVTEVINSDIPNS